LLGVACAPAIFSAELETHSETSDTVATAVAPFFRPFATEHAALAPDGRHVAFDDATDGVVSLVVSRLEDVSSRRIVLARGSRTAVGVAQLAWLSPDRLAFVLRNNSVGTLGLAAGEPRLILHQNDLDALRPAPLVGVRREVRTWSPDMPTNSSSLTPAMGVRTELDVATAIADAQAQSNPFDRDSSRRLHAHQLAAFILPDLVSDDTLRVEIRSDRDPLDDHLEESARLIVPANTYLVASPGASPPDFADTTLDTYGQYQITHLVPPTLVLAVDPGTNKRRELLSRTGVLRVITDRVGNPRLLLEADGMRRRWFHRAPDSKKWIPLASVVKDASRLRFDVAPETLLDRRSIPLGIDYDGSTLYFASNVDHDVFALRAVDLSTGALKDLELAVERLDLVQPTDLHRDDVLVFDPHAKRLAGVRFGGAHHGTGWLDEEIAALQSGLAKTLHPRRCRILQWDTTRRWFLLEIDSPGAPGGFHVFDRTGGNLYACAERAPWLKPESLAVTHRFTFATADDRKLSGTITMPKAPRLQPAAVLVYYHDGPWESDGPVFDRGTHSLAALGFAVLRLNYRGSGGLGREHLEAISPGWDRAVAEDTREALLWCAERFAIDPRMVATLGNGVGGYFAVRASQLDPDNVRCAVAINAPYDLVRWCEERIEGQRFRPAMRRHFFGREREALGDSSALEAASVSRRPVLVVHASDNANVPVTMGRALHAALKRHVPASTYLEIRGEGHGEWNDRSMRRLFTELGKFFNATIYDYGVEAGPAIVAPGE
jgi:acetyl esterase/lipase